MKNQLDGKVLIDDTLRTLLKRTTRSVETSLHVTGVLSFAAKN
jgi:hypothetical protein